VSAARSLSLYVLTCPLSAPESECPSFVYFVLRPDWSLCIVQDVRVLCYIPFCRCPKLSRCALQGVSPPRQLARLLAFRVMADPSPVALLRVSILRFPDFVPCPERPLPLCAPESESPCSLALLLCPDHYPPPRSSESE
jgi:hypothetical protein